MTDEKIETRGPGPWADAEETETETVANPLAEVNPYAKLLDEGVKEDAEKRHAARIRASVRLLRETDDTRLDDIGKTALFRSVASGIAGLHVHNPSEIFGRRATADIGGNLELLRRLTRGEWDLLDDPDVAEWRKVKAEGEEAAAKYAHEKIGGAKDASSLWDRKVELAGAGMPGAMFGNVMQNMEAPGRNDAIRRSAGYEALNDEEKAEWRRERIEAYERKLTVGNPVATFMKMTGGLDDRAKSMIERAWRTGELKREELERYAPKDQRRILGAVSLMRGDQKEGTLLFVPGVDVSQPGWKANFYAFQQSLMDIPKNIGEAVGDAYDYARASRLSGAEREEAFRKIDLDAQIKMALKQPLVEAESFTGAIARGLAENAWFIPTGMAGAWGKGAMLASQGLKAEKGLKGIVQGVKAGLAPWRAGRVAKAAVKEAEAAAELAKANRAAALSKGVKALGEAKVDFEVSQMAMRRQAAAMAKYTEELRKAEQTAAEAARRVPLRIAQWWGGQAVASASDAAMFSSFFREHVEAADAAGVSREESVPLGIMAGAINAVVEHLHMPGQEDNIAAAELKYLMSGCSRTAWQKAGKEGFRKWAGRLASRYLSQTAKVTAEEGFVEEPIQQLVNELGVAIGKKQDELLKEGRGDMASAIGELWDKASADGMFAKTFQIFTDAAWDALPGSLGFGLVSLPHMMVRQKARNVWYGRDEGLADGIQRAIDAKAATEAYWRKVESGGVDSPTPSPTHSPTPKNPHRFEEAMTAARQAFRNPQTRDVVKEVADAAGVDVKTAEVLTDYLRMEAELSVVSPRFSAFRDLNMSLADIGEDTIKTVLPGYVEGSFASDPENGIYSGRVKLGDGTERTIAYRVGDWSQIAAEYVDSASARDSELAASWNSRETGTKWEDLDETTRRAYALARANGLSSGKSGVFELTDSRGETVRVNADDVILLANGRLGDIGYGAAATQGTVRHETFHSLWRFVRKTMKDEDVQNLAKTFGIDVTKEGWERKLDETMAPQMERYASGHYVAHAVSSRFDRMLDSWAGKLIKFFGKFGPADEVTDPKTGKPYQMKGLYDAILRGELGSGALGVELRKIPQQTPERTAAPMSSMPVEVTDADRAAQEAETRTEAAATEPATPPQPAPAQPAPAPVEAATAENPADAATPNQVYYRVGLPNSPVKLVGRLEVRDVETGVITSTDADYHDRGNQNRDDKSEESRALVEKIGANPDPLQIGTVQPIASNGIIWMLPNGDVIIGNHRVNGVRLGYAKGTTAELEKFVREDAARRGIEIGADVKKPLMVFVLERIESPDGKADVHEVVRLANESQNRGFNIREQAGNDAKILADNNLLPRMEFRADGRIDETKSGDAIGKFRQETGAQGMIAEDGSLTEEGQTRIQNAALAVLLGGEGNNALLQKIMTNAGRLDMQSELRALMKMTPELMALAETKPAYDLRAPLAEALQLFTEWRDKDETARVEKGKTRHDWRETSKDGTRKRGLSWEAFMSQGDMFRKPSDEAKILGDLFAKAESLRSFDREDVESAAGKKRVIDLVSGYLADYIANARAVNTETDDMFGGSPASRAEVMAAQRATGGEGSGPRFSVSMRETLDPAAWGDLSRKVKVVSRASAPWKFRKGAKTAEAKKEITALAVENIKAQHNYVALPNANTPALQIGKVLFKIPTHNLFHGADRRLANNGPAAAVIGDVLNASVEVPNVEAPWHYRIAKINFGEPAFVLITAKESGGSEEIVEMQTLYSVNVKADATAQTVTSTGTGLAGTSGAARELNHTDTFRPSEESISNLRAAWQGAFLQNIVKHNIDSILSDPDAPVALQREAVIEKYKGTAEWLMAPNGAKSNLDEDQWVTVRTPAFKRWFGDWEKDPAHASKIVDANGEPLVVYRGAAFDPLAQEAGKGVVMPEAYFTADPAYAKRYGNVRAYYLNIRSPFDIRNAKCLKDLKKIYPDHEFQRGESGALDWAEASVVEGEFLKENFGDKYDGIIYDEGGDPAENEQGYSLRGLSYVPLDGGVQVKSATDNNGDFSKNPDVRYSIADQLPKVPKGTVRLAEFNGYYYAFGKDAEAAAPILGSSLVTRNGEVLTAFPSTYIDTMLARLIRNGKSAALLERNADGTFGIRRKVEPGRYSIAGKVAASNMGIKGAAEAEAMEKAGADRKDIWRKTGWWRGADGKWRIEIPPLKMKSAKDIETALREGGNEAKLGMIVDAPELFKAYPDMKNLKVEFDPRGLGFADAQYNRRRDVITIFNVGLESIADLPPVMVDRYNHYYKMANSEPYLRDRIEQMDGFHIEHGTFEEEREKAKQRVAEYERGVVERNARMLESLASRDDAFSVFSHLSHEVQHAIQNREHFASGSSPAVGIYDPTNTPSERAIDEYRRAAGEVEARNVQTRLAMTPEERAEVPPWETEDTPTDRQIVRYSVSKELTDAMRKREAMQSIPVEGKVQPWPENFPKVMLQTTLANIRQKWPELHQRAKAGSDGAALELVRNVLGEERGGNKANPKWEKLRAFADAHPRAIVSYVHAEEATGRNKIPAAYAYMINRIAGLRLADGIVQTVRAHHTGANAVERMTRRAAFDGPIRRGAEYILVDDHVTQGGTLNELRKYIQSHGGKVVAVTTLTASRFSDTLPISRDAVLGLYTKFGNNLDEELQTAGIANGVAELTQSQARELLKLRADTLRDRLAQARLDRNNQTLLRNGRRGLLERSGVSGYTDLLPGMKEYFKPDGTPTETGTRWANARQFKRPIGRELNALIDRALGAGELSDEETAALLDELIASAEATDEIRNGVLPNFRSDSSADDPAIHDSEGNFTPERLAVQDRIYDLLMSDKISGANNEALETKKDGSAREEAVIVRANEGRPDLPPISLKNPSYETAKEFRIDIIVGPPAAGKSSVFANALSVYYRSRVMDCDAVKKMLPGFNDGNGANYVHKESSMLNKRMIYDIQQRPVGDPRRGENVVLPILGDDVEGLRKKIADWHAAGYTVYLHNNRVPILHAFGRALVRTINTGRWINPVVIRKCQDNPTRAYNELKKEADYYDQFSNDVTRDEPPIWEDGNYADPAYGRNVRRVDESGVQGSHDGKGVDGRLERDGVKPVSQNGQYLLPGAERWSTEAPRSGLVYPQLRSMSDDELLSAAVAVRMALGESDKFSDKAVKINTVQKMMRRLHPDWDTSKVGLEAQRVILDARKFGKRIREDIDRGVSDSLILRHLPDTAHEQFGQEMRQEARRGQSLGAFGQKVRSEIEERQAKIVEDAVRVQAGLDAGAIENAFGINLSETIMHLAENSLREKPPAGADASASGTATDGDGSVAVDTSAGEAEIDARVKAVVEDILKASMEQSGADARNRADRKAAAGRDAENEKEMGGESQDDEGSVPADSSAGEGDALAEAVKKSALNLENPRHLARFVAELARRQWIKEHGLALNADVWRDLVAVQFLRKTAQSVYAKLCRDLVYSRSRETAMQRIAKLDSVPTVQGLLSEMEFVGALINAQRIRDTQKQMCEKLDLFLRQKFGAQGRFKPDKEEGKRSVSAEAELRARYMRHAMWLTPDAAADEARQLQETLDALSVDFADAGRDRDQSREFVETIRKLNVLREFGALRYKPVGEIEAAVQWWEDFANGESDAIVREMSDRDIRTKKAAHLLAVAFADPKRTTIREGGKADALNRFITGHMGFISLLQDCMRHASDADAAAVKDIVDYIAREVQKAGDRSEAEKRRHNDAFHAAVESIYGKGFNAVMRDMMAPDERFMKYMGVVGGKRVTPTKGRALQLLVSLLQEGRKVQVEDEENPGQTKTVWEGGYHDNIVKHHREGQAAEIMRLLDPADMNMLKWLGQWYENNRSDLSGVCHSLFGIGVYAELPNYFPVKMMLETQGLEKGQGVGWTIFPKALTPRVRNERDFDTSADIFSMWASRMEEAAQWKHHAQLGLEMRGIFGRAELREAVRANHGASVDELMQGFITDILAGHGAYDRSTAGVQYFSDQIRGWTALCALGGNIGVMAKQTTSIPAFGFEIGLVNTAKYMVNAFTPEGMAAMRRIWDSEQRRTRWQVGSSEAVRNALNQQGAGALKRMFQASMITNKLGDVVPALVVGQGIYRDCLARGMSEEDAMAETWSLVERTQQSGRMENQTSIQRRNKLGRIMFQFLSTQQQYLQYEVRAIREVIARPDSVKRWGSLGRAILLNHFILSSAYYWMGQLYKYALGQEPPEDELKDWVITCLLGPYGSLFVAGFCCKYTLERAIKGYSIKGGSSMLPMESWLKNQVNDGAKLLEAIFDSDGDTWDNMLEAAGRWMSDSNSTVRDLRKLYRYRVKGEPQRRR